MSIPSSITPLFSTGSSAAAAAPVQIERSLRFNSSDSAYLSRTPGTASTSKTWTLSFWVKLTGKDGGAGQNQIFGAQSGSGDTTYYRIWIEESNGGTLNAGTGNAITQLTTTNILRDYSAWYHILVAFDTTQSTAGLRHRVYINGIEGTYASNIAPSFNTAYSVNSTATHYFGFSNISGRFFNGYLADCHMIDGQALDATAFTEVSATTGQLIPKAYAGTYTGNSFWLKFNDNSAATATTLGKDSFLLGNNWTPNNLSTSTGGPTSVAAASGALPVYNTTGTYGTVKGTGTRTDTNSASIVLAIPMDGTNNGTTFTDESATIKGSGSAVSITRYLAVTKTNISKYYGSSGYFGGESGDAYANAYLQFGTQIIPSTSADFTVEMWVYLPSPWVGTYGSTLLTQGSVNNAGRFGVSINTSKQISLQIGATGYTSTAAFSLQAWAHIAFVRSSGTIYLAVNGIVENKGSLTTSPQATTTYFGSSPGWVTDTDFHGYVQDLRVYSGVAKYTSNFNPPSDTANATVAAGNDSLVDTPTSYGTDTGVGGEVRGNYATLNPLANGELILADGNLNVTEYANATRFVKSTIGASSGKFYWEVTNNTLDYYLQSGNNTNSRAGIAREDASVTTVPGSLATHYVYEYPAVGAGGASGRIWNNNSSTDFGLPILQGDILNIACDFTAGKIWYGKNGTFFNGGNPLTGTNASQTFSPGEYNWLPVILQRGTGGTNATANFGQRAFAHPAPSGFKALCDTNLGAPLVALPSTVFNVITYTGNGSTQTLPNANSTPSTPLAFSPDWVWIKKRSASGGHPVFDTVRGTTKYLQTHSTGEEGTDTDALTAFNSDGFTLGSGYTIVDVNQISATYVAWAWDAGANSSKTYTVTVASAGGANRYFIDGVQQATINLEEGSTYIFDQSAASNSNHPLRFSTTSNGTHSGGTEYTTGVTTVGTPGNAGAYTQIAVASGAPALYYYCTNHSGMGGAINTNTTAGASNFVGSITSTVRVNVSAGFSVVTYTGTGATGGTVGHGLGVAPGMIIIKNRDRSIVWVCYHSGIGSGSYLLLNTTNAKTDDATYWGAGIASTTFGVQANNASGINYLNERHVAYCFAPVVGYSSFGSYVGTFTNPGPFVYTGFRPAFVLLKNSSLAGSSWIIYDNKRNGLNETEQVLNPDSSGIEATYASTGIDFLSNGFKIRGDSSWHGQSGEIVIYAAFAENPFQYARAR